MDVRPWPGSTRTPERSRGVIPAEHRDVRPWPGSSRCASSREVIPAEHMDVRPWPGSTRTPERSRGVIPAEHMDVRPWPGSTRRDALWPLHLLEVVQVAAADR